MDLNFERCDTNDAARGNVGEVKELFNLKENVDMTKKNSCKQSWRNVN